MSMKPIIFSGPVVKALLDGKKTQTRQVVKQAISSNLEIDVDGKIIGYYDQFEGHVFPITDYAPYKPGDVLWVREVWGNCGHCYLYKADHPDGAKGYWYEPEHVNWCDLPKWRSSIHMPRAAARIFLRVNEVRVERLNEITEEDAQAEGFEMIETPGYYGALPSFEAYWNLLNAKKKGCSWEDNPFCFVYSFERTEAETGC